MPERRNAGPHALDLVIPGKSKPVTSTEDSCCHETLWCTYLKGQWGTGPSVRVGGWGRSEKAQPEPDLGQQVRKGGRPAEAGAVFLAARVGRGGGKGFEGREPNAEPGGAGPRGEVAPKREAHLLLVQGKPDI